MKTVHLLIIFILVSCTNLYASPAYPGLISFVQPDGSKINIYLKGDDKVHWAETEDGYSILFNSKGTYEYAVLDSQGDMVPSGKIAKNTIQRSNDDLSFLLVVAKYLRYSAEQVSLAKQVDNMVNYKSQILQKSFPLGIPTKLLCILIGFTDQSITKTNEEFENLLNQANYSLNGATGSLRDYFLESSYNQLDLSVTVAGPYVASNPMAYYGENDPPSGHDSPNRNKVIEEAVRLADIGGVNFADFDNDNDGKVDGVYVIYAGYGEEGGGPADCIWAHEGTIAIENHDGKVISRFACSPELAGNVSNNPSGNITNIGVICHEFGHTLGSLDFYDVNYGTDGLYDGTGYWDLMATGMWNNSGKTPAQPNAYNKCFVYNWATATNITESSPSSITINNSSAQKDGSFYRISTATTNEYFLLENRQQEGFDASIPGHGLLVYHVDGEYIASHTSSINTSSHQGMYVMAANSPTANGVSISSESKINTAGCTFSAANGKTSFTDATTPNSKSWALANTGKPITNITENNLNKSISFNYKGGITGGSPSIQASSFSVTDITHNSVKVNWVRGNGNSVVVVARKSAPVDNDPINGIFYTASPIFGASNTELGTGNFVVYNGTGTSVTVTNLLEEATYYFSVYEANSVLNCYTIPALTGNCIIPTNLCNSYGTMTYPTSITRVSFNTIVKVTGKPAGYNNYSTEKTVADKGLTYTLSVNLNTGGVGTVYAKAWIDWNHNNSFAEVNESYDLGFVNGTDLTINEPTSIAPSITIPSSALVGPTHMRISCKFGAAPGPCDTAFDGEVEDYSLIVTSPITWEGSSGDGGTDWNIAANWNPNVAIPSDYSHVTLPSVPVVNNVPVISGSALCYNLTVQSGAILTIGTAGSLTVNGNLTNNAGTTGLVQKSAADGTGSLKILGSVTGSATVERYMTPDVWHLISSPTSSQSIVNFLNVNTDIAITQSTPTPPYTFAMRDYNPSGTVGHEWNPYYTSNSSDLFTTGKGYIVGTQSPILHTVKFEGALNTLPIGNLTVTSGWNLIGNPFTSAIQLNGDNSFLSTNGVIGNKLESTIDPNHFGVYMWNGSAYEVINDATAETSYAQIGQGFFVKVKSGLVTTDPGKNDFLSFEPIMQAHQVSTLFKAKSTPYPEIKLIAASNNNAFSTSIKFIESTTTGLDIGYDAGLFKSNDSLAIFTRLVEDNGVKFQLQCLPTNEYNSLVIPVGIVSKSGGEIVFTVQTAQLDPKCKVILEDRLTNTFTDLSKDSYKTIVSANTDVSDRFFLHTSDVVSGFEDQEISSGKLRAFAVGNLEIRVIGEVSDMALATLYNGLGKVVLTKKLSAGNLNIIGLSNIGSGVYILNVNEKGTNLTIKIIVR